MAMDKGMGTGIPTSPWNIRAISMIATGLWIAIFPSAPSPWALAGLWAVARRR